MKYIAFIDEEMLSNFRIDEPPCYMSENDKILVVKDELGYTRGIQLKPLPKGHGRLIDADAIKDFKDKIKHYKKDYAFSQEEILNIMERCEIKYRKTIIDADKESD